jgi:hypothetical protein
MIAKSSGLPKPFCSKQRTGAIQNREKTMPFVKGHSGNPGGRPRLPDDVKALTRDLSPAAIETLATIMRDKNAPPAARVSAANAILDRGYGKPAQSVDLTSRNVSANMSDEELIGIIQQSREEAISAISELV